MKRLRDFFDIEYGQKEYHSKGNLTPKENGTPLISSKGTNQGVYGFFDIEPKYKKVISVPSTGTVCEAFYQEHGCCIDDNCLVLTPKIELSQKQMIYFVLLIRKEKYRYVYGRQVTPDRLGGTKIMSDFPKWIDKKISFNPTDIKKSFSSEKKQLNDKSWGYFLYSKVFDIERGYYNKRPEVIGNINFISASMFNNGVTDKIARDVIEKLYACNCIAVVNNGHAAEAFYQKDDFTCSHDVNILRLKDKEMTPYLAMFLIPIIRKEKYRFNYGRKWRFKRMEKSIIKLPITKSNTPDWQFMEEFIKGLPYSGAIGN